MAKKFSSYTAAMLALAGAGLAYWMAKRSGKGRRLQDQHAQHTAQLAANASRTRGAISSVTGGAPEDINYMPPTDDFARLGPTYDGSDLERTTH